jgi:serine/threonine protein kinase
MAHTYHRYKPGSEPVAGYKVTVCLGSGGFGEVWKGIGPGGTEVAIKIIDLTGQQGVQEFKSLGLVKKCVHPNLVPIHAFWLKDEDGNVVSDDSAELSSGADIQTTSQFVKPVELIIVMGLGKKCLNKRLQEVRDDGLPGIPCVELLDYMDAAARGIDYLNTQVGIVHGDIKPHNILVVGDAAAVCDFGLARAVESLRKTSMAPMTVAYAAPESFRGKPTVKSDQYSLAITYIELRTGRMPFDEGLSPFDLMNTHVTGQLNLDRLPPYEREVIRRATALNPDDRWNNNRDFARALTKAFEADPQAKLLAGSPFNDDYEAKGFVATLKKDSRSSSLRGEFNRQTRENVNRGVTPSTPMNPTSLSGNAPTFAGSYDSSFDFNDAGEQAAQDQPAASGSRPLVIAGLLVGILLLAGYLGWSQFGGSSPSPSATVAVTSSNLSPLIDRLTSERQFQQALTELDRYSQHSPQDTAAQDLVKQKREQVRVAWLALAEQAAADPKSATEADRLTREILAQFPNDPQATKLLASKPTKTETKPAPPANRFDLAKFTRDTEAFVQNGRWVEAMDRFNQPQKFATAEDLQQIATLGLKIRAQWVSTARAYLDAGQTAAALKELTDMLARYPAMHEARAQLVRAHVAQSSFQLARSELEKLRSATNLPPEGQQQRDALGLIIDLRTQKREPTAMYDELLKLKNIDGTPDPTSLWTLSAAERDLLRSTRDTLLEADYAALVAGGRTPDQMALTEKLLTHLPARKYELLLVKSEIQTDADQCDEARASIDTAEKTLAAITPAQTADHKARRTIVDLRDSKTETKQRATLIAEAEKVQGDWQPARRGDLGKVLVALVMKDRAEFEPIAMRILLAAVKLEPQRADLYNLIKAIRGDEWNPRVARRLEDTNRPTREQWQQLYDDCVALSVLKIWNDNRFRAICQAARAEAMCELGLKLDEDALKVIGLGGGWPSEGYIYYVDARVTWETQGASDKVKFLVDKALKVAQKPVQLDAEFRQEVIRKMQSGAAPTKRTANRLATPSKLLSTYNREKRRVFRLTADQQPAQGLAASRQAVIDLYERSESLEIPARIEAWKKIAQLADDLSVQTPDATIDRIAAACHEQLAATARVESAEHFRRAIDASTRWINLQPSAAAYTSRARAYIRFTALRGSGLDHQTVFKMDRFQIGDLCEADLTKAIELAPTDPEPRRWLGRLNREQGNARGGDEIFTKAVELARPLGGVRLIDALRDWGENLLLLEQLDEARARAEQFISGDMPVDWLPQIQKLAATIRGEAWFRQSKWSEAIAAYDQAIAPGAVDSATIDDLPLLLHRAEARLRLRQTEPDNVIAAVDASLVDLVRARALAADALTQASIHAQAAQQAVRAVEALPASDSRAARLRHEGLEQAKASLALNATSQESVTVRVAQLKLLLNQLATLSASAAERDSLTSACRKLHTEAQQLAAQTGLATELGELLRLEDQLSP